MRNERPIHLSPEDFSGKETPLEDQGYWRKKMSPLPGFLVRKKGNLIEKEEPSLSNPKDEDYYSPSKKPFSLWNPYKKNSENFSSNTLDSSYQPIIHGRYVLVMTKLSMWSIAFCLLLLGVLFYLAGFFSALYLLSASSHSDLARTGVEPTSLTQKIGTFIDRADHKNPALAPAQPSTAPSSEQTQSSSTPQSQQQKDTPPISSQTFSKEEGQNTLLSSQVSPSYTTTSSTQSVALTTQENTPQPQQIPSANDSLTQEKAIPGHYFMLQFGEFRTKDNAIKLAQELSLRGYQAKVFRSLDQTNKLWFYVRANTYPTRSAAQEAIQKLPPNEKNLLPLIIPSDLNENMKIIFP